MNASDRETRLAVMARMVKKSPDQKLGRTQLMKLLYFLQELKGIPLDYDFRLFNYGPFESEVLSDLKSACGTQTVVEKTVQYGSGFGYSIAPGVRADSRDIEIEASNPEIAAAVDEVVKEFGGFSASELELRSTIFYVDREFVDEKRQATVDEVSSRVKSIKFHFDLPAIQQRVEEMNRRGQLRSVIP